MSKNFEIVKNMDERSLARSRVRDGVAQTHSTAFERLIANEVILRRVNPNDTRSLNAVGEFRLNVWKAHGQQIDPKLIKDNRWLDDLDFQSNCWNWVVLCGEEIIAAARVSAHRTLQSLPDAEVMKDFAPAESKLLGSLNRLVVKPEYEGFGLARLLETVRIEHAANAGVDALFVRAVGTRRAQSLSWWGFEEFSKTHDWSVYPTHSGPFHAMRLPRNFSLYEGHTKPAGACRN